MAEVPWDREARSVNLRHGTLRCCKKRGHSLQVDMEGSSGHAVK